MRRRADGGRWSSIASAASRSACPEAGRLGVDHEQGQYNVKALRNQEMAIGEQAERAYEHLVGQWRQKLIPRRLRSASVAGSP